MLRRSAVSAASLLRMRTGPSAGVGVSSSHQIRQCSSSATTKAPAGLVAKESADAFCRMTDIANATGPSVGGNGDTRKMSAGDVLGMMDLCACNVAKFHITGKYSFGLDEKEDPVSVATIAVDHTPFVAPILSGDTIVVEGHLIHAGKSSVGVAIEVFRSQFPTRKLTKVCHSFFSMVAIDKNLQKANVVPPIKLSTPRDARLNSFYLKELRLGKLSPQQRLSSALAEIEEQQQQKAAGAADGSSCDSAVPYIRNLNPATATFVPRVFDPITDLECAPNKTKRYKVKIEDTAVEANRVFFPQYLNMNNTIFGGELMRWMEAHALQCGKMFTMNRDVRTLGMYNVVFSDAVQIQDWVTLNAHVVYVHRTTLEVEVEITVRRSEDQQLTTNRASFVIANFDDAGAPMEITTGLDIDSYALDCRWRSRYADARARYEVGRLTRADQYRVFGKGRAE